MYEQRIHRFLFVFKLLLLKHYVVDAQPKGHLKPLGSHCLPDAIEERIDIPDPHEFWNEYVKVSRPVVFRGAAKQSKAFKLWTDEYLKKNFGKLEVRLERKLEKSGKVPVGAKGLGRDTIGKYSKHTVLTQKNGHTIILLWLTPYDFIHQGDEPCPLMS